MDSDSSNNIYLLRKFSRNISISASADEVKEIIIKYPNKSCDLDPGIDPLPIWI